MLYVVYYNNDDDKVYSQPNAVVYSIKTKTMLCWQTDRESDMHAQMVYNKKKTNKTKNSQKHSKCITMFILIPKLIKFSY